MPNMNMLKQLTLKPSSTQVKVRSLKFPPSLPIWLRMKWLQTSWSNMAIPLQKLKISYTLAA